MKPFASIFGQMNVDLIFHGIDTLPALGTEVFASDFAMCVGGGPIVIPYHLDKLGVPAKLGTILENDFESYIARELLTRISSLILRESYLLELIIRIFQNLALALQNLSSLLAC